MDTGQKLSWLTLPHGQLSANLQNNYIYGIFHNIMN